MAASFFFYDLETSGFNPREARIMQFAGQRTDMDLKPIGEPVNVYIKLTPDVLPDPDAVLITGITPQQTLNEGLSEAEFLKYFYEEVVSPDTVFLGFNSIRFDDEFMRFLLYRNFYDSYEWQWQNGCSRWDILDLVRMTRALKPEGIKWPFAPDGSPANRLEYLTKVNMLDHYAAHDALSDVHATIAVAKLIMQKQPELFKFALESRGKKKVQEIVESGKPFMYTSGKYPKEFLHTTAAVMIGRHSERGEALVYDLRQNPEPFLRMTVDELIEAWKYTKDPEAVRLPVKTIKYNHCPAIVPGVVKDDATLERLQLSRDDITANLKTVAANATEFAARLFEAKDKMDALRQQEQVSLVDNQLTVDARLYDGFFDDYDKKLMQVVRGAEGKDLSSLSLDFHNDRLGSLLPLYKARNYPGSLNSEERAAWDAFVNKRLFSGDANSKIAKYFARLGELAEQKGITESQRYLLEELQLYGESVVPAELAA